MSSKNSSMTRMTQHRNNNNNNNMTESISSPSPSPSSYATSVVRMLLLLLDHRKGSYNILFGKEDQQEQESRSMLEPLLLPLSSSSSSSSKDEQEARSSSKPSCSSAAGTTTTTTTTTPFSFFVLKKQAASVLRLKFLLIGLILGFTIELLFVVKYATDHYYVLVERTTPAGVLKNYDHAPNSATTTTTSTPLQEAQQRIQSFLSGCFSHEISFLCSDVLLVTYIFLLARHTRNARRRRRRADTTTSNDSSGARRAFAGLDGDDDDDDDNDAKRTTHFCWALSSPVGWDHAVAASNFLTGVVLGAMTTLTIIFGHKKILVPQKLSPMILTISVGIAMCFLAKATVVQTFAAYYENWNEDSKSRRHQQEEDDDDDVDDEDLDDELKRSKQQCKGPPSYDMASIV